MSKHFLYAIYFIVSILFNFASAMFLPPVWAMCDCAYNTMKGMSMFPGSLFIAIAIVFSINQLTERGNSYTKSFLLSFFGISFLFAIYNILLLVVLG